MRILLTLLPYLCFTIVGLLPHVHKGAGIAFITTGCGCTACLAWRQQPALVVGETCPTCQWQQASQICSVALPVVLLPVPMVRALPAYPLRTLATLLIPTASRAPPAGISCV